MTRRELSGAQYVLRSGDYEATVASVGASLRTLTFAGRNLVVPFSADEVRPFYRGTTLAPWPNRVVDGRYEFAGQSHELPLTEPSRGHALHGLASWQEFAAIDTGSAHVTLDAVIEPQAGYPWRIRVITTYRLADDGLTQTVKAVNESGEPAPWGTGPHPYLVGGEGTVNDWTLTLPAAEVLTVTDDRLNPIELRGVDGHEPERFDFREPRTIATAEIDHAYTALQRSEDGSFAVELRGRHGNGVRMTWDESCPWVQIHTADQASTDNPNHRIGLAVEPMTCAPDAFNAARYSYDSGLITLAAGASSYASWRIADIRSRA
tara:strand:+ start:16472 stop:17431 length:960 start_codon:yes stop_codon:yes gene_type:complete